MPSLAAYVSQAIAIGVIVVPCMLCLFGFYMMTPRAERRHYLLTIVVCGGSLAIAFHFLGAGLLAPPTHPVSVVHQRVVVQPRHTPIAKSVPTKSVVMQKKVARVVSTIPAKADGGSSPLDMLLKFLLLFGGCIVVILFIVLVSYWSRVEAQRKRRARKEQVKW